jgi:hypothetical protein
VCCDRYRSCGYSCKRHYLCRECHAKVALCPFCRAPQLGVYPDLWYCGGSSFDFKPLTEAVVRNGISSTANAARFSKPHRLRLLVPKRLRGGGHPAGDFREPSLKHEDGPAGRGGLREPKIQLSQSSPGTSSSTCTSTRPAGRSSRTRSLPGPRQAQPWSPKFAGTSGRASRCS